jgi:hypothetical protein
MCFGRGLFLEGVLVSGWMGNRRGGMDRLGSVSARGVGGISSGGKGRGTLDLIDGWWLVLRSVWENISDVDVMGCCG